MFREQTSRTDWANVEAYRDKMSQRTQFLNQHPFDVEDCGVYVIGYADYLSEGMNASSDGFDAIYHHMRYASLLQKYGMQKTKRGYVSENDHPPRPRTRTIPIPDESGIVCIE
ncbi:hypothetical protein CQW23_04530 [Capsicum baccatum]|uniref:Ubiquitin-like protease family profile domain-containing protein n=1 Tax=Capsicum baccatum TaxID=33114 RepID=A0A2G2XEY5_CAPBA|nr:hypothetical protein CQW23_04530 [Capsicum baccatum]